MDQRVATVIVHMQECLAQKLCLNDLARAVNLSPSRLSHIFKADVGLAPMQYLAQLRMEKAGELLRTTFLTVGEIRVRVGINDESHFLRDFKRAFGMPPRQYRSHHAAHAPTKLTTWQNPPGNSSIVRLRASDGADMLCSSE